MVSLADLEFSASGDVQALQNANDAPIDLNLGLSVPPGFWLVQSGSTCSVLSAEEYGVKYGSKAKKASKSANKDGD